LKASIGWITKIPDMSAITPSAVTKILKKILRLNLARQDFEGVKALAEWLIANPVDPLTPIFRPCMAGIVTTYARSFIRNDGIGRLEELFTDFDDDFLKDTHAKLLRLRHAMYAHRDTSTLDSFTYAGSDVGNSYQLRVRIDDSMVVGLCSNAPELNPENLPNVVRLCTLQARRAHDAVAKLLPLVMKGKKYPPRIYTAGVDFP
jgi:hypothetical protein